MTSEITYELKKFNKENFLREYENFKSRFIECGNHRDIFRQIKSSRVVGIVEFKYNKHIIQN